MKVKNIRWDEGALAFVFFFDGGRFFNITEKMLKNIKKEERKKKLPDLSRFNGMYP